MKSAPISVNESQGINEWHAIGLPRATTKSWYSRYLEGMDTFFGTTPAFFNTRHLTSLLDSFFTIAKEQGLALLTHSSDILLRKNLLGVTSQVPVSASFQDVPTSCLGFYIFRNEFPKEIIGLNVADTAKKLSKPQQYRLYEFNANDAQLLQSLPQGLGKMQLQEKPNKRLNQLYRTGTLSEEVASMLEAGLWEYSFESEDFFFTDYVNDLLRIPAGTEINGFAFFLPFIMENDRETLASAWDGLVKEGVELNKVVQVAVEGSVAWVRLKGKTTFKNEAPFKIVGVIQDVTECLEKERQLAAETAKAEYTAQMKSEFVSYLSHEIRTPLNAIMGLTYLLSQEESMKEEFKENLNSIHFSSQSLLALINNTLDYSKMEAGKVELEKVNFDLKDLLKNTHQALCLRSMEKRIDFELSIDPRTPEEVAGDPVRLMQILNNLLSNAIKFTDKGSVKLGVDVVYQTDQEWVLEFTVVDTGIGIPSDKQNSIFESFTQAASSTHRQYGGTGLGLSITKNLVDLHKGNIQVKSVPGEGSMFSVRLRFIKPQSSLVTLPKMGGNMVSGSKLRGVKILVVDDNAMNKTVATKLLTNWYAEVDTAEDGLTALEKINRNNYDIVLMDLYMPVLDGFQTVSRLREEGCKIPVVALTANANAEERKRSVAAGVNDYLTKPFVPQDLFNKILQNLEAQYS